MALRDTIRKDVQSVFMDSDDLAEAHTIDFDPKPGIPTKGTFLCIFDEDTLSDGATGQFDTIYKHTYRLFIAEYHLPTKPVRGAKIKVDNVLYTVQFIEPDNFGMTEMLLERNRM